MGGGRGRKPRNLILVNLSEQAFLEAVATHQAILHKVCRIYCDSPEDRRDLLQEMLLQLWRAWPGFREEARVSTWMYRIALNTAISDLRKRQRQPQTEEIEAAAFLPEMEAALSLESQEQTLFLREAIRQLSSVEKAIVMLYLESHSYEEIAEIIGITPTHVGVKLNRIRRHLSKIIKPHFS